MPENPALLAEKPALERGASDRALFRLLCVREKLLLDGTPEALGRARRVDNVLERATQERNRAGRAAFADVPGKLFVLLTRSCQLDCPYCTMSKAGGNLSDEALSQGIEILLAGRHPDPQLHFFGGEPLLRFPQMRRAVGFAEELKKTSGKRLRYVVTTNGLLLSEETLEFFKRFDFTVVMSADGARETFGAQRPGRHGENVYEKTLAALEKVRASGVSYYITVVVSPESAAKLEENVLHLVGLGHRRIEVTYEVGREWPPGALQMLLGAVGRLVEMAAEDGRFELVNITESRSEPLAVKSEFALDVDGGLYRHLGILLGEGFGLPREDFFVGWANDARCLDGVAFSLFDDFTLLSRSYARNNEAMRKIVLNNIAVGLAVGHRLDGQNG